MLASHNINHQPYPSDSDYNSLEIEPSKNKQNLSLEEGLTRDKVQTIQHQVLLKDTIFNLKAIDYLSSSSPSPLQSRKWEQNFSSEDRKVVDQIADLLLKDYADPDYFLASFKESLLQAQDLIASQPFGLCYELKRHVSTAWIEESVMPLLQDFHSPTFTKNLDDSIFFDFNKEREVNHWIFVDKIVFSRHRIISSSLNTLINFILSNKRQEIFHLYLVIPFTTEDLAYSLPHLLIDSILEETELTDWKERIQIHFLHNYTITIPSFQTILEQMDAEKRSKIEVAYERLGDKNFNQLIFQYFSQKICSN